MQLLSFEWEKIQMIRIAEMLDKWDEQLYGTRNSETKIKLLIM